MDPLYLGRVGIAGWVFVGVILASLAASNSAMWQALTGTLQQALTVPPTPTATTPGGDTAAPSVVTGGQPPAAMSLLVAVVGALVVFAGAPALGFFLERVVAVLLWARESNMWHYSSASDMRRLVSDALKDNQKRAQAKALLSCHHYAGATFQVFFYTFATDPLLDWARRRRTQMYACYTAVLSIWSAIAVAWGVFHAFAPVVVLVSIVLSVLLVANARREEDTHRQAIEAWGLSLGEAAALEFRGKLKGGTPAGVRDQMQDSHESLEPGEGGA
jgi:hypothetical protein